MDWGRLFSYLARVLPELFDILFGPSIILDSKKEAGEECCAELAEALCDAECAAVENVLTAGKVLCSVHCAKHAANCCDH